MSNLLDGVGGLDGDGDLVHVVDLDLGLKGRGEVDGSVDTSADLKLAQKYLSCSLQWDNKL